MKKQLLLIFMAFSLVSIGQVCTPDTSLNVPGIFPPGSSTWDSVTVMPDGYVGSMYDEVAQIFAPSDTTIDTMGFTFPAIIDSLTITGLEGLPPSMSYACNNGTCFYVGGEYGCMRISGTPTSADLGFHLIKVWAYGSVTVTGLGQLADSIFFLMSIDIKASQGVDENFISQSVKVSPNPIVNQGVISFEVPDAQDYTFELIDLTGKKILSESGTTQVGTNNIQVERNGLSEGLYFYSIYWNGLHHTGRLMFTD